MGNKFEVWSWVPVSDEKGTYEYQNMYRGQSLFKAIYFMIKSKVKGNGCVKLEWR